MSVRTDVDSGDTAWTIDTGQGLCGGSTRTYVVVSQHTCKRAVNGSIPLGGSKWASDLGILWKCIENPSQIGGASFTFAQVRGGPLPFGGLRFVRLGGSVSRECHKSSGTTSADDGGLGRSGTDTGLLRDCKRRGLP